MPYNLITDLQTGSQVEINDRGLQYGDGLFETLLIESSGRLSFWDEHYKRLQTSADRLAITCPDKPWLERQLESFQDLQQTLVVKIILTRGSQGRGLSMPLIQPSNIYLSHFKQDKFEQNQTIKATISEVALPENPNLAGLKHLNRLDYVLATDQLNKRTGFDEAILLDTQGFVIESIVNNIFFVKNNEIFTPELTSSGVEGIMREIVLKHLKQTNKNVNIGKFKVKHLMQADECFLCNSVQGIRPVITIDHTDFPIGEYSKQLTQDIYGSSPD